MGIDTNKGLLLSGPVGRGKTSLMKLLMHLAPHKTNYEIIPTRNIVFNFNASGYDVLEKYNLNVQEIEKQYGSRVRSRLRQMMNVIAFDSNSVDKRL